MVEVEFENVKSNDNFDDDGQIESLRRAAIPGGWLVKFTSPDWDIGLTFVPDAKHEWKDEPWGTLTPGPKFGKYPPKNSD